MKHIDLMYQTMLAELADRSFDAQFQADFPFSGRFVPVRVKDREYWYFDEPIDGKNTRRYVGPKSDLALTERVARFREIKDSLKTRRKFVSALKRDAGMSGPIPMAGDVIEALADAGLFRLRAVLVGTAAFNCYSGILGVRLPNAMLQTGDVDFAQDFAISAEVKDSLPPIIELLKTVDPTFRAVPHHSDKARVAAFTTAAGFRVEFLTSNRGSDDNTDKPSLMPALGGAAATPLRFMDYLLYEPVRTVMLHKAGVSVVVPSPERYAIHKMIIASRRKSEGSGSLKKSKDIAQASFLCEALVETRRGSDLAEAYKEAWDRGPAWQTAILAGRAMMSKAGEAALADALG